MAPTVACKWMQWVDRVPGYYICDRMQGTGHTGTQLQALHKLLYKEFNLCDFIPNEYNIICILRIRVLFSLQ